MICVKYRVLPSSKLPVKLGDVPSYPIFPAYEIFKKNNISNNIETAVKKFKQEVKLKKYPTKKYSY